jgi:hypothetical protein
MGLPCHKTTVENSLDSLSKETGYGRPANRPQMKKTGGKYIVM